MFNHLLFIIIISLIPQMHASAELSHLPAINPSMNKGVTYGESVPVEKLSGPEGAFVYIYERETKKYCNSSVQDIFKSFQASFNTTSELYQNNSVFSVIKNKTLGSLIQESHLAFIITSYKETESFGGFFLHRMPNINVPAIVLNCAPLSRRYWKPSLVHELTHAFLFHSKRKMMSSLEEGVAQALEEEAGGTHPHARARQFYQDILNGAEIPSILDESRPISDSNLYALSYLFIKYLRDRFGGWETIFSMLHGNSFSEMIESTRESLISNEFSQRKLEKFTPQGLIRFFSVAFIVDSIREPLFSIPNWSMLPPRVALDDTVAMSATLKSGQFMISKFRSDDALGLRFSTQYEVYRLHYSKHGVKIVNRDHPYELKNSDSGSDVMLIINTQLESK